MKYEEMGEKYCNEEVPFDTTESGEKLYTRNDLKRAYIAGLKAGSQLDEVWRDYDAGEDCYEDIHKGKWIKRETSISKPENPDSDTDKEIGMTDKEIAEFYREVEIGQARIMHNSMRYFGGKK